MALSSFLSITSVSQAIRSSMLVDSAIIPLLSANENISDIKASTLALVLFNKAMISSTDLPAKLPKPLYSGRLIRSSKKLLFTSSDSHLTTLPRRAFSPTYLIPALRSALVTLSYTAIISARSLSIPPEA